MKRSDCELFLVGLSHQAPHYFRHQVHSQSSMTVFVVDGQASLLSFPTCVLPDFSSKWPQLGRTCLHVGLAFSLFTFLFLITFRGD